MKTKKQIQTKKAPKAVEPKAKKPLKVAKDADLLMVCGGGIVVECQF